MNILKNDKLHIPILLILCAVLFFWKITVIPLTDGDSAFYAKIAKNIVQTGDWLTMHYGDADTIINKPPLVMWLTAASFKLIGINDFAATFWHSIFSLLIVIFTYYLAKEIYNKRTAMISAIVLATSAQFFYQARSPIQDIPLTLFTLLTIYLYYLYEKTNNRTFLFLAPVFAALGVLTKGPVGLALPAIVIFLYILIARKKFPSLLDIAISAAIFFAVTLPWFYIEYRIIGQRFIDVFVSSNFGRYLKPIDTVGGEASKYAGIKPQYDFYSFFLQLFLNMIPWSGFVYPAIYYSIRKKHDPMPVVFALAVICFFSFSLNYKISRYILPALPALAILTGKLLSDLIDNTDKTARRMAVFSLFFTLFFVMLPLLALVFLIMYVRFADVSSFYKPLIVPFLTPLVAGLLLGPILMLFKKYRSAIVCMGTLTLISYFILIYNMAVIYPGINPVRKFCSEINKIAGPEDVVVQYKGTDAHFMLY
jgi:4-amino-4-deoxy-L-arabinose transferase-like glycosyltransferase